MPLQQARFRPRSTTTVQLAVHGLSQKEVHKYARAGGEWGVIIIVVNLHMTAHIAADPHRSKDAAQ